MQIAPAQTDGEGCLWVSLNEVANNTSSGLVGARYDIIYLIGV
jgi:hypothetical protein